MEKPLSRDAFVWGIASLCNLHRIPFDAELLIRRFSPAYDLGVLQSAIKSFGFKVSLQAGQIQLLHPAVFPVLVLLNPTDPAVAGTESSPSNVAVANGVESSTEEADIVPSGDGAADAIGTSTDIEGGAEEPPPEYGLVLVIKTDGERVLMVTRDSRVSRILCKRGLG